MSNPPSNYDANFVYVGFNGYCHVEEATPLVAYPNNYLIRKTAAGIGVGQWGNEGEARAFFHFANPITKWNGLRFGESRHRLYLRLLNLGAEVVASAIVSYTFITADFAPATLDWVTALALPSWGGISLAQYSLATPFATPFTGHLYFTPAYIPLPAPQTIGGGASAYGLRISVEWPSATGPFAAWSEGPSGGGGTYSVYSALIVGW